MSFKRELWSLDLQASTYAYESIEDTITKYEETADGLVKGSKVHVPVVPKHTATNPGVGGVVTFNEGTLNDVVIELSVEKNDGFYVQDVEQAQTNVDIRMAHMNESAKALKVARDEEILKLAGSLTQTVGTYGVNIDDDTVLATKLFLDKAKAPKDRLMVVPFEQTNALLKLDKFVDVSKYGSNMPIMEGELGRIYGFRVIGSDLVESTNKSGTIESNGVAYVKETFGIAYSIKDRVSAQYDIDYKKWKIVADCLFGVKTIRPEYGVLVKC